MRRILLNIACIMNALAAQAAPVTANQAQHAAMAFLDSKAATRGADATVAIGQAVALKKDVNGHPLCYAVNIGQGNGFVLVSGSDLTDDIIGYSDKGVFDENQMPAAMRAWLENYTEFIRQAEVSGMDSRRATTRRTATKTPIAPLLKSTWGQAEPYNEKCPQLPGHAKPSLTGCTITAMAQIMYYYQWPKTATPAIPGYTFKYDDSNDVEQSYSTSELPSVTFEWDKMYSSYNNNEDGSAVAVLMQYLGQASRAKYMLEGTSASGYSALKAMQQYFGYDKGARVVWRNECTYDAWIDMLYEELQAKRPVMFSGTTTAGSHSFVVDGYDYDDYFHVNWGWGGGSDGYFKVLMMNPKEQGDGGNADDEAYSMDQVAFFGVQPDKGGSDTAPLTLTLLSASLYRLSEGTPNWDIEGNESVSPLYDTGYCVYPAVELRNYNNAEANFDVGLRLVNDDGTLSRDYTWEVKELSNRKFEINEYYSDRIGAFLDLDPRQDATLTDGKYKLYFLSKEHTATEWQLCKNADKTYIELTLDHANQQMKAQLVDNGAKLKVESLTFNKAKLMVDVPVDISIKLTNTGKSTYSNDLFFSGKYAGEEDNVLRTGSTVDIAPGETREALMTWIPKKAGEFNYIVCNNAGGTVGSGTVSVQEKDFSDNLTLTATATIRNADDQYRITGNIALFDITLTNTNTQDYHGIVELYTHYFKADADTSHFSECCYREVVVPASGKLALVMESKPLAGYASYGFGLTYSIGDSAKDVRLPMDGETYTVAPYYIVYDAQGIATFQAAATTIEPAVQICAIDLTTLTTLPAIDRTTANPNLLVYVSQDANISGDNIVRGDQAENIRLTDGSPFYVPFPFTATRISYTRTAEGTFDSQNKKGWSTLCLPFAATECKATINGVETALTWYTGNNLTEQADLTLMDFQYEDDSTMEFGLVGTPLQAHHPYLLGTPATTRGQQTLKGQSITFAADNATIQYACTWVTGRDYLMGGTYTPLSEQQDIYVLNADGNAFVSSTTAEVSPFHAYFAPATDRAKSEELKIAYSSMPTAITTVRTEGASSEGTYYDLQGRRTDNPSKGIYIKNGKKVMIK